MQRCAYCTGLQDSSSDEELDICGVNPASPIAAQKMRILAGSNAEGRQPPEN